MARGTTLTAEIAHSFEFYWQLAGDTLTDEQICERVGVKFGQLRGWLQRNVKAPRLDGKEPTEGLRDIRARAKVQTITGYLSKLHTTADQAVAAGDFKAAMGTWRWLLEKQAPKQYGSQAHKEQKQQDQEQTSGVILVSEEQSPQGWIQEHGPPVPE